MPRKKCPECDSSNLGAHKKTCSQYKAYQSLCDECGAPKSTHKRGCSQFKSITVCQQCHKRNGNHSENCINKNQDSKRSGVQAVNDGKWSEIKERVRHGVERGQLGQASYAEAHKE